MTLPTDRVIGDPGHTDDHNATAQAVNDETADRVALAATHAAASSGLHGVGSGRVAAISGGGRNIYVQNTAPTAEFVGDLWVDTSGG